MLQKTVVGNDLQLEEELERIEGDIAVQNKVVEDLIWRRADVLTRIQDLEMCALVDCIFENGLSANEALKIIICELEKRGAPQ